MQKHLSLKSCFLPLFFLLYTSLYTSVSAQTSRIDSLLSLIATLPDDTSKANAYNDLSRAYVTENNTQKVGEYGWKEITLAQELGYKKGIAHGLLNMGIYYRLLGKYDLALYNDKKALLQMQDIGYKKGESAALLNIGLDYSEKNDFKSAITIMKKGLHLKEQIGDRKGMSSGLNNLANIFITQGNYTEALKTHLQALKIREEFGDKAGIAISHNNIGNVLFSQHRYDEALNYYLKAAAYHESTSNYRSMGIAYNNIGNVYSEKLLFKDALTYHLKALGFREKAEDQAGIATSYNNIGDLYLKLKKTQQALQYQLKSYNLSKEIGNQRSIAEACGGLGNAYYHTQNYPGALRSYEEMLAISEKLDLKENTRDAYLGMANVYEVQKEFEKALKYSKLYNSTKDSLLNKENFKQITELNTLYETDKKEKEILLLTKDQQLNSKIIRQQQLVRWGLIGGLGLLSISIFSIYRRYRFKKKANVVLEQQKELIEQKNLLITDSIDYAQTIQEAVLPTQQQVSNLLPDSFVLYKPKATVSGDFYWLRNFQDHIICAVVDCTGHGVPGAFMSLLGHNMLENAIKDRALTQPAAILDALNEEVIARLPEDETQERSKHGMDVSLISINKKSATLEYAGAHNPLYIIRENELIELKADKMGIGGKYNSDPFRNQSIQLQKGDMIYLFTDGFPDQIGGPNRKKFYYRPFKELLLSIHELSYHEQKEKLNEAHALWMGDKMDQTDDIVVMGIRM
jgi:serine phosphatase RsbU (regulator of sigma subunit)/Tfp pilus assembly protein PilF